MAFLSFLDRFLDGLLMDFAFLSQLMGLHARPAKKRESRGSTEPRLTLINEKRKRSCYYFFFLAAGFFLAAVFFAAFFLAAIIHYLLRGFCRPMDSISVTHRVRRKASAMRSP